MFSSPAGADPAGDEALLEVTARGGAVVVCGCRDRDDAVLNLEIANRGARMVRVEDVSASYFSAGRLLRTDRLGPSLFDERAVERNRKIPGGGLAEWSGICLERIPEETDRIRLELTGSVRDGLSRRRATTPVDIAIRRAPPPVVLHVPFEGYWLVTQGHLCRTNHRKGGFGGDYAWDFVHVNPAGRTVKESYESTRRNEESHSFGLSVLSPVDGVVARVVGDVQDNEGIRDYPRKTLFEDLERPEWIFGNHVVIDRGDGVYVLLAHLMRGSVTVKPGDRVRAGEPIARCGNSGNTFLPHLHVQVMDRPDPAESSVRGLPARFANYREITYAGDETHKDILARVLASGDPPEGSIVAPAPPDDARP